MTKQEILERFRDINEAYNDSSRFDSLSRMLDELLKEQPEIVRCKDCKYNDDGECIIKAGWFPVKPDWFCADGVKKDD